MTIQEFKKQLRQISFKEDSTAYCRDILVNLSFNYPIDKIGTKWTTLRTAVMFFQDRFEIHIATPYQERYSWVCANRFLSTAKSAGQVLAYGIGEILSKCTPRLIIE